MLLAGLRIAIAVDTLLPIGTNHSVAEILDAGSVKTSLPFGTALALSTALRFGDTPSAPADLVCPAVDSGTRIWYALPISADLTLGTGHICAGKTALSTSTEEPIGTLDTDTGIFDAFPIDADLTDSALPIWLTAI